MKNSEIILILTVLSLFISSSAQATLADCPACRGEQPDWTESATAFLEGRPINDVPSSLSGPQQARHLNAQIDARKKASQTLNGASNAALPRNLTPVVFDICLKDIYAMPNPVESNDAIKIVTAFESISSNSTTRSNPLKTPDLIVYADIKNSAGLDVGRLSLKPSSKNEYSGIWNVSVGSGIYNATIEASRPDGSKTFSDALQITVRSSTNTTDNIHSIGKLG
jgi:hypothetical protein